MICSSILAAYYGQNRFGEIACLFLLLLNNLLDYNDFCFVWKRMGLDKVFFVQVPASGALTSLEEMGEDSELLEVVLLPGVCRVLCQNLCLLLLCRSVSLSPLCFGALCRNLCWMLWQTVSPTRLLALCALAHCTRHLYLQYHVWVPSPECLAQGLHNCLFSQTFIYKTRSTQKAQVSARLRVGLWAGFGLGNSKDSFSVFQMQPSFGKCSFRFFSSLSRLL